MPTKKPPEGGFFVGVSAMARGPAQALLLGSNCCVSSRGCCRSSSGVSSSSRCSGGVSSWCSGWLSGHGSRSGWLYSCWRSNRCLFFFAASGQGDGGQQAGDQECFFHGVFKWKETESRLNQKPGEWIRIQWFELEVLFLKTPFSWGWIIRRRKTSGFTLSNFFRI